MKFDGFKKIGSGGFGIVYRAREIDTDKIYAVKRLPKRASAEDRKRFAREVRIQLGLKHQNIMPIVNYNLDEDPPWLAMPLAQSNLHLIIPQLVGNETRIQGIFFQILLGVNYAHTNGVAHRDLKPENIMVFNNDEIKIADFGLGKRIKPETLTTTITVTGDFLGTMLYAPPEQIADAKQADERSDIYALGKILFHMLTGVVPFPVYDLATLPPKFRYIVSKCLQDKPEFRYQGVEILIQDFNRIVNTIESEFETIHERLIVRFGKLMEGEPNQSNVDQIHMVLMENIGNIKFWHEAFPLIKGEHLQQYLEYNRRGYFDALKQYDEYISGDVGFSYCDVIANLYSEIFQSVRETEIEALILTRLLRLGVSHNRFYVKDTFCRLVAGIRDQSSALVAIDVIKNNPGEVVELKDRFSNVNILEGINKAIIEVTAVNQEKP
jgi:tRNA A-37 threonylcarbamoyl transferase component Bud32